MDGAGRCVQAMGDCVKISPALDGEIDALVQVLADKAVEVLMGWPLPWAVRIAVINRQLEAAGQLLVAGHRMPRPL